MLFSSQIFVFLFLPLTLLIYFAAGRRIGRYAARSFLVLASLVFYGWVNTIFFLLIISSIVINYICAAGIEKWRNKRSSTFLYWLAILFNLGLLGYFKYRDFFFQTINEIFATNFTLLHLLLPLGISFFTFQQIAYIVDIREQRLQQHYSLLDYVIFVTFFPQLIAGPIVLPDEMMSQFAKPDSHVFNIKNMASGLWLFAVGLGKKVLLADFFATWVDSTYALADPNILEAWKAAFGYTLQIYYDFSGYCDMAIGLGLMFNVRLPLNFNSPYKSAGIQEFWRRWHMTLGRFLTMFVYHPLGGSKCGLPRTLFNVLCTFLISGLWHGAGWTFVIWGGLHGLAMMIQRIARTLMPKPMPKTLAIAVTFSFTLLAWVLFRAENWATASKIYSAMGDISSIHWSAIFSDFSSNNLLMFVVGMGILFLPKNAATSVDQFRPTVNTAFQTVILLLASIFMMNRISPFIYFNF